MIGYFRAAILALPLLAAVPALAQNDADARAFAERAIAEMQAAMPDASFAMEPGEPLTINVINAPAMEEGNVFLYRVYNYCQQAAKDVCLEELRNMFQILVKETPTSKLTDLRIIVRDAQYWNSALEVLPADDLPIHRQIGEDLYAMIAIDSPEQIAVPQASRVFEMGIEADAAWARAAEQTRAAIPKLPAAEQLAEQWFAYDGSEYMSSMLFDVDAWGAIAKVAGPDLFATATSDQFALFGTIPDGEALEEFKQAVLADCQSAPRCISPNIYRFRNGRWVIAD